ncbi:DUF5908 family protein [Dyadobacter sp. NIV53]|uniref:DUF5908 family protein n=1 Tax=Dyadobacter sp. NIV53 TaxID=2861765 RepID=UPI001C875757|nr:DUF5908 family protein [Dyadobacter sp. NIV53]
MLEIRELHIKAVVRSESTKPVIQQKTANIDVAKLKQEVIATCTERVLQKIKQKSER